MSEQEEFEKLKDSFIEETEKHIEQIKALSFEEFKQSLTQFFLTDNRYNSINTAAQFYSVLYKQRKAQIDANSWLPNKK